MEIRELWLKNFGRFTDRKIELKDGIHLLYGENESGKTTIHNFIKGMLFGMERGRGRASQNDAFSTYEPWENANYYAGTLRFESAGKLFRVDRNFDKYSKKTEVCCETDGERLSAEDGDLEILLGGLSMSGYENTVSVGQMRVETAQSLDTEFRDYATNYYTSGAGELQLAAALAHLGEKKKKLDKTIRTALEKKQEKRERMEQEASYVWRDVHRLEAEREHLQEEIDHREEKKSEELDGKGVVDVLRPEKWRIHPVEILAFIGIIAGAFIWIPRPWNYLVSIVIFLACGLYVWNRLKVGKEREKTPPELILEEITPEQEKVPIEKLLWEVGHIDMELKEKYIQYENLQEQLAELDEVGEEYREYDREREALKLAEDRLKELSESMKSQVEDELNRRASEIMSQITGGKYTKLLIEDHAHMYLLSEGKRISIARVSRGTLEQAYFALRMAAGSLLIEEEMPVILDDTFAYYDDERLERTLQWLYENKKQVLIFTCQKREEQALEAKGIPYYKEVI